MSNAVGVSKRQATSVVFRPNGSSLNTNPSHRHRTKRKVEMGASRQRLRAREGKMHSSFLGLQGLTFWKDPGVSNLV